MTYTTVKELPKQVQNTLPAHGQEIYLAAFNNALDEYKRAADRKNNSSKEETAHKVAWSAVKNVYHKNDAGKWVKK